MRFLRNFCLANADQDYMDAAQELYHQRRDLRK